MLDPIDELAFFSLECEMLGTESAAQLFCEVYTERLGDAIPDNLIAFHKSCRSCLRAKLSVWHLLDGNDHLRQDWLDRAHKYLDLAEHYARLCVS